MNFRKKLNNFITLIAMTILLLTISQISEAASYKKLIKNGYKISTLTRSKGGASGWNLSNGKKRFFLQGSCCRYVCGKNRHGDLDINHRQDNGTGPRSL